MGDEKAWRSRSLNVNQKLSVRYDRPEDELFLNLLKRTLFSRRVISPRGKCHGSERAPTVCKWASDDYARQQGEPALQDLQLKMIVRTVEDAERKLAADIDRELSRRVFDSLLSELYVFDAESFRFVKVSEGARRNIAYSMAELRALTPWDLKPDISKSTFREMVAPLLKKETTALHFETVHKRKDVSLYPVEAHLQLLEDGPPVFVANIVDMSEKRMVQEEQRKLALVAERASNAVAIADAEGRIEWINEAYVQLTGYTLEEIRGKTPGSFLHGPKTDRTVVAHVKERLRAGKNVHAELINYHKSGRTYWAELRIQPICRPDGTVEKYVAILSDLTARKRAEAFLCDLNQRLEQEKERFDLAVRGSADGLWDWELGTNKIYYSPRLCELLGYSSDELQDKLEWFETLVHPEDKKTAAQIVANHLHSRAPYDLQYRLKHKDGSYRWFRAKGQALWDESGKPIRMAGSISDISELKRSEEAIRKLAETDALTALPNRREFHKRLAVAVDQVQRVGLAVGVMLLDLDNFKGINDTLGHHVGDGLLREVADRIRTCVGEADTVARLGGDEFVVVVPNLQHRRDIDCLANRILSSVAEPFNLEGQELRTGASIGVAVYPENTTNAADLLRNADLALYRAKQLGRGVHCFYEEELRARMQARQRLEADLCKALARGEFELHYQPLIDLKTHEVTCFEALMRWRHPTRGLVSPAEFIPFAEEAGLIVPLGEWAIRQACAVAASWPERLKVAVNLSPVQFKRPGLVEAIASALTASCLPASRLELEITESVLLDQTTVNLATLHQLRGLGVRIALDDFGTGYSSLSYLQSFPFDKLKIDHSFIKNITTNKDSIKIVQAIVMLARSFGVTTTAEGVETQEQLDTVRCEGCDEIQGYFIGRPKPAEEVERLYLSRGFAMRFSQKGRRRKKRQTLSQGEASGR